MLKKLIAKARAALARDPSPPIDYPLEMEAKLNRLHSAAQVRRHLDILYGDVRIGDETFTDLYFRCLEQTGTAVTPFNVFQRFQTRHDLLRYFFATLQVPGARIECGAYRGATALLICRAWRSRQAGFKGKGFYLLDSFSGTKESSDHDLIPVRDPGSPTRMAPFFPPGKSDVEAADVRGYFQEFPEALICEGWIPEVFGKLPDTAWAFVHLDLTLYEATLGALRYFYPRLSAGGVLVCDGSVFCPGAQKAVDEFAAAQNAGYVVLGHREAVFLKP